MAAGETDEGVHMEHFAQEGRVYFFHAKLCDGAQLLIRWMFVYCGETFMAVIFTTTGIQYNTYPYRVN